MTRGFYRKVIRITGRDSPNVALGLQQAARGEEPTHEELVPGVLSYENYLHRLSTWDPIRLCVGVEARWWEGAELLLFPPDWLNAAAREADRLESLGRGQRRGEAIGIDPAEGGDKTALSAVDRLGLIELLSVKTPDTSVIEGVVIEFGRRHGVPPDKWVFDRGGGGYEHACNLRSRGFRGVRTVGFGEAVVLGPKRGKHLFAQRVEVTEERYVYLNRRAQMYHDLSLLVDPGRRDDKGNLLPPFALPGRYGELRHQLAAFPREYDREGRIKIPPKNKREGSTTERCLVDLIGHSPDEADATVLAVHGMLHESVRFKAGIS